MEDSSFGAWLQRCRRMLDLTQADLGRRVGVSAATIRKIEADERRPSEQVAARLADALAVAPAERPAFVRAARGERYAEDGGFQPRPARLPTGTVTFLCTDIVGSTRLWEGYGSAMLAALARHDAIVTAAITAHGVIFNTSGDGFYAAFADLTDAVAAALAIQRLLSAEPWERSGLPESAPIRVRIALHVGAAHPAHGDYHGPALNRIARILAIGHGGQVLLSRTAADLARDLLAPGVALRDLGSYQLRDLSAAERIFQLIAPDLPADFPPLAAPHDLPGLPVALTPLIGRSSAVAAVRELLLRPNTRLVTITGAGGVGKTRVAIQVATELHDTAHDTFPNGVVFVPLAAVTEPALVDTAIARALGLHDRGDRPALDQLLDALRARHLLLVLDNLEQVLEAAPQLVTLLAGAPGLRIVATSRASLRIAGEHVYALPPLALPLGRGHERTSDEIQAASAIQLFIDRAQAAAAGIVFAGADLAAVAAICERLDGLPLAIELAAARCLVLSPRALLAQLFTSPLELLAAGRRDLPARQQTLRATLDWSFDILPAHAQALLAGLGAFAGGFTLAAAQTVLGPAHAALDALATLVEHSLVRRVTPADDEPRFIVLEIVREYALDRLAATGRGDAIREQHARLFLAIAEEAELRLRGPEQRGWLARLDRERMNLYAALTWALGDGPPTPASKEHHTRAAIGARLTSALIPFWWRRGYAGEGQRWIARALAAGATLDLGVRTRLLAQTGRLAWHQGEYAVAVARSEEACRRSRDAADSAGLAFALTTLGMVAWYQGESAAAEQYLTESLAIAEADSNDWTAATVCLTLGLVAYNRGEYARQSALLTRSLALARACEDSAGIAEVLLWSANIATEQGELDAAEPGYREALARYRELGDPAGIARALHKLADLAHDRSDLAGARVLFDECLATLRAIGDRVGVGDALIGRGDVAFKQQDLDGAALAYSEALALIQARGGAIDRAWAIRGLARVACARADYRQGRQLFMESLRLAWVQANPWGIAVCLEGLGGALAGLGQPALAAELFGAADGLRAARRLRSVPGALPDVDHDRAAVCATLGAQAFAAACARGSARQIEEVIADLLARPTI